LGQKLKGNGSLELSVLGLIDYTHPPSTQLLDDYVSVSYRASLLQRFGAFYVSFREGVAVISHISLFIQFDVRISIEKI
jgi:hypothetical protein